MNTDTKKNGLNYDAFNVLPLIQNNNVFSDKGNIQSQVIQDQQDKLDYQTEDLDYEEIVKNYNLEQLSENNDIEQDTPGFWSPRNKYWHPITYTALKAYDAIKEEKIQDAWRMANIQGHTVNLSKKLDNLMSEEGTWVPQLQTAQEYVDKKLLLILLLKEPVQSRSQEINNLSAINSLLEQIDALEPKVKELARTNPYLLDLFYETKPGNLFSNEDLFGVSDVLKYYTYDWLTEPNALDIDPSNNFKHMLEYSGERGLNWFGLGSTHKLSPEQIDYMWQLKNKPDEKNISEQYNKLNEMLDIANILLKSKNDDIVDKINTIHKGNFLFDPTKLDPEFKHKFETNELSLTDPKSWFYSLPHLGSSYTELGAMAAQITASLLLNLAAKGALATTTGGTLPLLYAATEIGINAATNTYMRLSETASELFDAYSLRVLNTIGDENLGNIVDLSKSILAGLGYPVEEMSDFEIFQASLANQIQTDSSDYNQILKDAKNGRDMLEITNNMLSLSDMLEATAFSYGGKYIKNLFGLKKLANNTGINTTANMLEGYGFQRLKTLDEASEGVLDRTLTRVANKITKEPSTSIAVKHALLGITELGKTLTKSYLFERTEEGVQSIVSDRYQKGMYDQNGYTTLSGLANTLLLAGEANLAYYGLHPDNNLNTDKDLINSMKVGGFTGLFMTGVYGSPDIYRITRQVITDNRLKGLLADNYAQAEKSNKIELFLNVGTKKGNFEYVFNTLQELKSTKPEGVTDQMIDEDILLAKKVYQYSGSSAVKKIIKDLTQIEDKNYTTNYSPSKFKGLITNAILLDDRLLEQREVSLLNTIELDKLEQELRNNQNELLQTFLDAQYQSYKSGVEKLNILLEIEEKPTIPLTDEQEYKNQVITSLLKINTLQASELLIKELEARKGDLTQLKEDTGLDVNVKGISGILRYVQSFNSNVKREVLKLIDNARKSGLTGTNEEILLILQDEMPVVPNLDQIKTTITKKLINDGALLDLVDHRNAYITGEYYGDARLYKPMWDKLPQEIKDEIISFKTKNASEKALSIPTEEQIILEYNQNIEDSWNAEDQLADKQSVARRRARLVIMEDLQRREEQARQAKIEKEELFGTGTLENLTQEVELTTEQQEEQVQNLDAKEEQKLITATEVDKVEAVLPPPAEGMEEVESPLLQLVELLNSVSDQELESELQLLEEDESVPFLDAVTTDTDNIDVIEGITNQDTEIQNREQENIEFTENQATLLEEAIQQIYEDVPTDTPEELNLIEEQLNPETLEGITVETEEKEEKKSVDPTVIETLDETIVAAPETKQTVDFGSEDELAPSFIQGTTSEVFVDPGLNLVLWDPTGQMNVSNAIVIADETLHLLDTYESLEDPTLIGPSSYQNNTADTDSSNPTESKNKWKRRHIQNTFFYQPTATEVMPIRVAGKEVVFTTKDGKVAERKPGSELAKNLATPGWLASADDVYYVVTSSTHSLSSNELAVDNLAVHMIIEKDGKVYNTSLRAVTQELQQSLVLLNVPQNEIDTLITNLRALRSKIIKAYAPLYFVTKQLPTIAQKHVKPTNLRLSNGTLNNLIDEVGLPMYRKLNEVSDFNIPTDPNELTEQIENGLIEIGYGVGTFTVEEPFSIMKLDLTDLTSVLGKGYAGKLFYIPKVQNTPSQRVTLPIMLSEETHRLPTEIDTYEKVVLARDTNGNIKMDQNGKPIQMSTAEFIYELLVNGMFHNELDEELLGMLANHGSKTVVLGLSDIEKHNLNFMVRKQLHMYRNKVTNERMLITGTLRDRTRPQLGYTTRITNIEKITEEQKKQIVFDISLNIHWNTDKERLMNPFSDRLVDNIIKVLSNNINMILDENTRFPFGNPAVNFSLKDLGYTLKDGAIVKRGDTRPNLMSWMLNQGVIKTDLGEQAFESPFVYADDIQIDDNYKLPVKTKREEVTSEGETIVVQQAQPVKAEESKEENGKKTPTIAEPATLENLDKYNLTIPQNRRLPSTSHAWCIITDKKTGNKKVTYTLKKNIAGLFSTVQGTGRVNKQEAVNWLVTNLGIDPSNIEVTNAALSAQSDKKVFGIMLAAVNAITGQLSGQIHISEEAGLGIEYHEGFHYVTLLMLDEHGRDSLYQDYVNRNPKAKDLTKDEVEELLAEEFRSWMLKETNPTLGYKAIKFFRNVLDFIKAFIGFNSTYSLSLSLFNAIKSGEFRNYNVGQKIISEFSEKHPEGLYYYIPGISRELLEKMPNIVDANTFYLISNIISNAVLTSCNIKEKSQLTSEQVNLVFDDIQENLDNGWISEEYIGIVEDVLNNKDIFRKTINAKLEQLKLDINETVEKEELERLDKETGDNPDNTWDANQGDHSKKDNVAFNAKLFFYSVPKRLYKFIKNENGIVEKVLLDELDEIFGLPIPESFSIVWNEILENMWDIDNFDDLVAKSKELGNTKPLFHTLYEMLTSLESPLSENTKTQLEITIKSSKNKMNTIDIHPDSPNLNFNMSDDEREAEIASAMNRSIWEVLDSDNLRKVSRYPSLWSRAFFTSDNINVDENGNRTINKNAYTYISTRRSKINALIKYVQKNTAKLEDGELKLQQMKDAFLEICNAILIPFDDASLDYLLNNYVDNNKTGIPQLNKFISFWSGIYALETDDKKVMKKNGFTFNNGILGDIVTMHLTGKSTIDSRSGQGTARSLDRIFNSSSTRAQINQMAVAYGKTHPNPEEFSVTGADGSLIYPISENNYMSDQIRNLNKNLHGKKEQLLKNPYSSRSLIANAKDIEFSLHTFIAMQSQGESRDYFGITPIEDYISKLTLTFNNLMTLPTMSDKKTWYSISGLNLVKDVLSSVEYDEGAAAYDAIMGVEKKTEEYLIESDRLFGQNTLNIFANYWMDEFDAVLDYFVHKKYVAKHPELRRNNYHGKIKNGVMDDSGNGGRFRYFSTIVLDDPNGEAKRTVIEVNKEIATIERNGTNGEVIKYLQKLKALMTGEGSNVKPIYSAMNNFLLYLTDRELEALNIRGIVQRDETTGRYKDKLIPHNIYLYYKDQINSKIHSNDNAVLEEDIIYSIIGSHVANSALSTIEIEKCFTGDPAFYKWLSYIQKELITDKDSNTTVEVSTRIISGRDVDKIKRLSAVLSTGTNLRTYWGSQATAEENSTKYTVLNLKDNAIGSDYHEQLYQAFRNSLIRDLLSEKHPDWTDDQLIDAVSDQSKEDAVYESLSEEQKKFVDDNAKASAKPYAYGDTIYEDGEINQADAAVYMRPAMYRKVMKALGKWSDEIEAAYDVMEGEDESWMNDPKQYAKVRAALINPLKMVYFGDNFDSKLNLNIPVFNKMAIFPMFKMLANADNRLLYDRMNNQELGTIDMLAFESAVKVGGTPTFLFYKDATNNEVNIEELLKPSYNKITNGIENLNGNNGDLPVFILDISNLRLQLNTDPHEHTDRSFGTLAVKILFGNVVDDRSYGQNKGKNVRGKDLKLQSMNAINALTDKGAFAVLREFYKDGKINNQALSQYLIKQARTSGMSLEVIQGFELNSSGEFNIPLAATSSRNWVESRIISFINKEVIDINTPGGSAVLMSSFGFKATGPRKSTAADKALNGGNKLRFLNDDGSMDIILSSNFFRHIVPKEYQNSYGLMKKWLVDHKVIGTDSTPIGIGYRIPTQGLSSTFSFKVVGIMPDRIGDTAIVPDEFTAMTGSDFDVDKLYIAMLNVDENGEIIQYAKDENGVELPELKLSVQALLNRIITNYQLVVSDKKNMAETRASIDTLTKRLQKNILPLVKPEVKLLALPGYELLPSFLMLRKEEYTGGKAGIAPFALNSTNHCLTLFVHLNMKYSHNNMYGLRRLDAIRGRDGYRILDWLSAMINAHVDVAKDPYIMTLNVNQITYNMTNLLLRGGMGLTTFYFLAQPILKQYADRMIANKGMYGVENKLDKLIVNELYADYTLKLKLNILSMKNSLGAGETAYNNWVKIYNGWCSEMGLPKDDTTVRIQDSSVFGEIIVDHSLIFNDKKLIQSLKGVKLLTNLYLYNLLLAMKAYDNLSSDAQLLSELVHRSQIDTKKFGNNLADQLNFNNSYTTFILDNQERFFINPNPINDNSVVTSHLIGRPALDIYFKNTFLEKKRYYGTTLPRKILRTLSYLATKYYQDLFTSVFGTFKGFKEYELANNKQLIAYQHIGDKKIVKKLNSALESIVRARITTGTSLFSITDEEFNSMLYGVNSMCKRLSNIKRYIISNKDSLPDLVNLDGTITNGMLNYMLEYAGDGKEQLVDRIVLFNSAMNNDVDTENMLVSAFYDLLNSSDEHVKEFAEDLAKYAYFTSYDNRGVNSFFHLVPNEWKLKNGYVSNIKSSLKDFAYNPTAVYDSISEPIDSPDSLQYPSINITIARNMWNDDNIVPYYKLDFSLNTQGRPKTNDRSLIKVILNNKIVDAAFSTSGRNQPEFIKVRTKNKDVILYRKVALAYYTNEEGLILNYSIRNIYKAVPKLGILDNGFQVYEFQKESTSPSAFAVNDFDPQMEVSIEQLLSVYEKALPYVSKKNKSRLTPVFSTIEGLATIESKLKTDLTKLPDSDAAIYNVGDITDNVLTVDNDVTTPEVTFGEEQLAAMDKLLSLESINIDGLQENVESFENFVLDVINVGEEFAAQLEFTPETQEQNVILGEDMSELVELGKKRKKECD